MAGSLRTLYYIYNEDNNDNIITYICRNTRHPNTGYQFYRPSHQLEQQAATSKRTYSHGSRDEMLTGKSGYLPSGQQRSAYFRDRSSSMSVNSSALMPPPPDPLGSPYPSTDETPVDLSLKSASKRSKFSTAANMSSISPYARRIPHRSSVIMGVGGSGSSGALHFRGRADSYSYQPPPATVSSDCYRMRAASMSINQVYIYASFNVYTVYLNLCLSLPSCSFMFIKWSWATHMLLLVPSKWCFGPP